MHYEKSRLAGILLLLLDMLLTVLVFIISYNIREYYFSGLPSDFFTHLGLLPIILTVLGLLLSSFGAYKELRISSRISFAWLVIKSMAITMAILLALLFLLKVEYISRAVLLIFVIANIFTLVTTRVLLNWWYFKRSIERGENYLKVVIIGTGERARRLSEELRRNSEWGIHILGYLDTDKSKVGADIMGSPVLGTTDEISAILEKHVVDEVIFAIPRTMIKDVQKIVDACEEEGVRLRLMADVFDLQAQRMRLEILNGIPLLTLEPVAQNEIKLIIKRLMDLVITLSAMPVLLPIFAVIAIAIKLDSKGPVFFIQQRVGLRKRLFPMYKFRSMHIDAEERIKEIEHLNEADGPIFKIKDDPRVTRVGKFIRKTSLDELPQLFNVIRGHMSLVGPRPMSMRDVNLFDKGIQRKRFSVRPGLTCIWQISGRSNLPFEKWLELDLQYIDHWSLGLDMKILLKTIPEVLKGSGAV